MIACAAASNAPPVRSRQTSLASSTSASSGETATSTSCVAVQRASSLVVDQPLRIASSRSTSASATDSARRAAAVPVATTLQLERGAEHVLVVIRVAPGARTRRQGHPARQREHHACRFRIRSLAGPAGVRLLEQGTGLRRGLTSPGLTPTGLTPTGLTPTGLTPTVDRNRSDRDRSAPTGLTPTGLTPTVDPDLW